MGRRALTRTLAAALGSTLLLAAPLVAPLARADEAITGTVHRVLRQADGKTAASPFDDTVVVYVADFTRPAPPGPNPVLRQLHRAFVPDVLPVVKGQTVDFANDDDIIHNVFSNSRAVGASTLDLGKYKHGVRAHAFEQTGVVDLYCDIHESMSAKLLVVPNPSFAVLARDGSFTVTGVPPGKHTLWAWSRHGTGSTEVTVTPGKPSRAEITVAETSATEPHLDKYKKSYATHVDAYGK